MFVGFKVNEPGHNKTYEMACAHVCAVKHVHPGLKTHIFWVISVEAEKNLTLFESQSVKKISFLTQIYVRIL